MIAVKGNYVESTVSPSSSTRILVVEDEPAQRLFLDTVLRKAGYDCHCAASCEEGRRVFRPDYYALCLLDLGLPDGSGQTLLTEFTDIDPCVVPIVLTGDGTADSVIGTMRAGAFDYLTKPIDRTTLMAALARAQAHYDVRKERAELLVLLMREKEQLEARVVAATADIRQYALATETSNTRLRSLLSLTQLSAACYSADMLMRHTFRELARHMPLQCLALCDVSRERLLSVYEEEGGSLQFIDAQTGGAGAYDLLMEDAAPDRLVRQWIERFAGFDTTDLSDRVFPQTLWNRTVCTVGFYLAPEFEVGPSEEEFLDMCAHFLAFEWEQANLLLHVAHNASLGSIAVELTRNFIQPLTALRTATDFVLETLVSPEAIEGMHVVRDNVERLRRQTQEFRKLSLLREDCVETVRLDEYINQALDILAVAIQNRGVVVEKSIATDSECVLLNGTVLARTFLDLILSALRSTELGGRIRLGIREAGASHVAFEILYTGVDSSNGSPMTRRLPELTEPIQAHPGLQLAERTIHTCGGTLSVATEADSTRRVRVVLPRNATNPGVAKELTT